MTTTCKDCIFAERDYLCLTSNPPIYQRTQTGCEANRLDKFEKEWAEEKDLVKREYNNYYILHGLCNLCTAPSRAKQLNIKTVQDAKNIVKIDPLAIVFVKDGDIRVTIQELKKGGFTKVQVVYINKPADYTIIPILYENFAQYAITKYEDEESEDFVVDNIISLVQPKSYCVFESDKPIPEQMVKWLNDLIVEECKTVLMVTPNVPESGEYGEIHGFWCLTRLHKFWNGNVPTEDGVCLEEKIYKRAKKENQTEMIYTLKYMGKTHIHDPNSNSNNC